MDPFPGDGGPVIGRPQMVLDITSATEGGLVAGLDAGELTEDLLHGLPHHIGQHIQPPWKNIGYVHAKTKETRLADASVCSTKIKMAFEDPGSKRATGMLHPGV